MNRTENRVHALLEQSLDVVFRYALRLTHDHQQAEDLTQETMLRAWRHQHKLREPASAKVWLLQIATNLWKDGLRRDAKQPRLLVEAPPSRERSVGKRLIEQENVTRALQALDQLPPRQRQVLYLVTVEQLSQAEVAKILGVSTKAVKASLSVARKQLRSDLHDLYDEVCGKRVCGKQR